MLASVPDTRQAQLALLANSVPTTATVNRRDAKIDLKFDGEPKLQPIDGTKMSYAINAQLPVILSGQTWYALDNGVWFTANATTGPWSVATEGSISGGMAMCHEWWLRRRSEEREDARTRYPRGAAGMSAPGSTGAPFRLGAHNGRVATQMAEGPSVSGRADQLRRRLADARCDITTIGGGCAARGRETGERGA